MAELTGDAPAIAAGAVGAIVAAALAQGGRATLAWREVASHDLDAVERNEQLVVWVDDRTRALVSEMQRIGEQSAAKGVHESGINGRALAEAKERALHEYRDEEWKTRADLAQLRAKEGAWHGLWRLLRRRPPPALTTDTAVRPFLNRWREPVTRHGTGSAVPLDRTTRTSTEALDELARLKLT